MRAYTVDAQNAAFRRTRMCARPKYTGSEKKTRAIQEWALDAALGRRRPGPYRARCVRSHNSFLLNIVWQWSRGWRAHRSPLFFIWLSSMRQRDVTGGGIGGSWGSLLFYKTTRLPLRPHRPQAPFVAGGGGKAKRSFFGWARKKNQKVPVSCFLDVNRFYRS